MSSTAVVENVSCTGVHKTVLPGVSAVVQAASHATVHGTHAMIVDNSWLVSAAECQLKGSLKRTGYGGPVHPAAHVGGAVHAGLAAWMAGACDPTLGEEEALARALHAMHAEYAARLGPEGDLGLRAGLDARLQYPNVAVILTEWARQNTLRSQYVWTPDLLELGYRYELGLLASGEQVVQRGRLDGLLRERDPVPNDPLQGTLVPPWVVLEHKTTGKYLNDAYWDTWKMNSGVMGYCWAAGQATGVSVSRVVVNVLRLAVVPTDPVRKCARHGMVYAECGRLHVEWAVQRVDVNLAQQAQWERAALALCAQHAGLPSVPKRTGYFNGACERCEFKEHCRDGRGIGVVPSYDPLAGAQRVLTERGELAIQGEERKG